MSVNMNQFRIDNADEKTRHYLEVAYDELGKIVKEYNQHPNDRLYFSDETIIDMLKQIETRIIKIKNLKGY